jgi:hypothetical protein
MDDQGDSTNLGFLCSVTKRGIDSGFDADDITRSVMAEERVQIVCPHCGNTHAFHMFNTFGRLDENPENDKKGFSS